MSVAMENRWKRKCIAEAQAANDAARQREVLLAHRAKRMPLPAIDQAPCRREVRRWMRMHASEYETATALVEAANASLDLPQQWLNDETHWVWDEAVREHET